jgi:acylphosphatase
LIAWCRLGPRLARVDRCEVLEEQPTGEWAGFSVLR